MKKSLITVVSLPAFLMSSAGFSRPQDKNTGQTMKLRRRSDMRRCTICAIILLCLSSLFAQAQESLSNDSVLKLVKAGLSEDLIVQTVNSQPGKYALGADDIVALKQAGVSDKIIGAMLKKNEAPVAGKPTPGVEPEVSAGGYPNEIGVYIKRDKQWIEVQPEVINWKTGGVLKSIASAGIVKGDVNGHLNGGSSRNKVNTPLEFCIYAPEGVAITEYQLLRLREQKDYREFRTVTGGVFHVKGGATRDLLPFEGNKVASRTFVVTLQGLGRGEYGFLPPGAFTSANSSSSLGKMYSFSVLE
jgi:hypothetical protein